MEVFYVNRTVFIRRSRIFVLLDIQFIRRMWVYSFDQKILLDGNMNYKYFGNRLKFMSKELFILSYNELGYVEKLVGLVSDQIFCQ